MVWLTVHPGDDNGLQTGNDEKCDSTEPVCVNHMKEDYPSLKHEQITFREKSHGRQEEIVCQKEVKLCFSFWLPKQYPSQYSNFLLRTVTFPVFDIGLHCEYKHLNNLRA